LKGNDFERANEEASSFLPVPHYIPDCVEEFIYFIVPELKSRKKMKFNLQCALVLVYAAFSLALDDEKLSQMVSSLYQKQTYKVTNFFQTAGTPVQYSPPSLRSEEFSDDNIFAHFTTYKDSQCTRLDSVIDAKINRNAPYLGNVKPTVVSQSENNSWIFSIQQFKDDGSTPLGAPEFQLFKKDTCYPMDGHFTTLDIVTSPKTTFPGGGQAWVFYDVDTDCLMGKQHHYTKNSENNKLSLASLMVTWPTGVCSDGFFSDRVRALSCGDSMSFNGYVSMVNGECSAQAPTGLIELSTDKTILNCSDFFEVPLHLLCIEDESITVNE
jgi:hypothetical protein